MNKRSDLLSLLMIEHCERHNVLDRDSPHCRRHRLDWPTRETARSFLDVCQSSIISEEQRLSFLTFLCSSSSMIVSPRAHMIGSTADG